MCGIVAGCGTESVISDTLKGLKAVEYRGYDSAGYSIIHEGALHTQKAVGTVNHLIDQQHYFSNTAISHTRWATHGDPSIRNAHPHMSHNRVSIVHNGIIENYQALKTFLADHDYTCVSDSDSEVIAHLLHFYYQTTHCALESLKRTSNQLIGSFAIIALFKDIPDTLYATCQKSPLILGQSHTAHWLASDAIALAHVADQCWAIPDQHYMVLTPKDHILLPFKSVNPSQLSLIESIEAQAQNKGDFDHFMLKEIHEQPSNWTQIIETYFNTSTHHALFPQKPKNIHMVACGSSHHAALTAQYWLESIAQIPSTAYIASEYRDRTIQVPKDCLLILISQSGETADTLSALRKAKHLGYTNTLSLCNVAHSTLSQSTDHSLPLLCGPEIGVASTKAFTAQLWIFLALTVYWAKSSDIDPLDTIQAAEAVLALKPNIQAISKKLASFNNIFFIGKHLGYPIAEEAALKLKEISYIHTQAYASGELKHGPLALIDDQLPVCAAITPHLSLEKQITHLEEIAARKGILVIFYQGQPLIDSTFSEALKLSLPQTAHATTPMIFTLAYQLLAYYVAVERSCEIDQPRNLAKSVTVE